MFWILETISRSTPSSMSSSVSTVESATVTPLSDCATKPLALSVKICRSSSASFTPSPSISYSPLSRIFATTSSALHSERNLEIAPRSLPYLGPSVLSWGFNLYLIYTEASLATVIFFTLSSSKTMAFSSSERFKGFSDTTTISASG